MREYERSQRLEQLSDECVGKKNFGEALLHLTHAIKLQPNVARYYEKRSTIFLHMDQYYYAHLDAKQLIELEPDSPAGYLKKASIEFETGNYKKAIVTYQSATKKLTEGTDIDIDIDEFSQKCVDKLVRQEMRDKYFPWFGAALGLVIGMAIVTSDYVLFVNDGFLRNPLLKVALIISNSFIFYRTLKFYRNYLKTCRQSLLKPPPLLHGEDEEDTGVQTNKSTKFSRFKSD